MRAVRHIHQHRYPVGREKSPSRQSDWAPTLQKESKMSARLRKVLAPFSRLPARRNFEQMQIHRLVCGVIQEALIPSGSRPKQQRGRRVALRKFQQRQRKTFSAATFQAVLAPLFPRVHQDFCVKCVLTGVRKYQPVEAAVVIKSPLKSPPRPAFRSKPAGDPSSGQMMLSADTSVRPGARISSMKNRPRRPSVPHRAVMAELVFSASEARPA